MASAVEDLSSLPGESVNDHEGRKIGKIKDLYGMGRKDDAPMWVTVEVSGGAGKRLAFVPLARLKQEHGEIRVPYSSQHISSSPEVEAEDELSEEDERALRDYYAIDLADQEMRTDNESYANRVPDEEGSASKIDPDQASAEQMAKEAQESREKAHDELYEQADQLSASRKDKPDEEDPRAEKKKEEEEGESEGESGSESRSEASSEDGSERDSDSERDKQD
jgi:sporulation protein YlmC with PRC-barrel domain